MNKIEFSCKMWQRGDRFVIKSEMVLPTQDEAQQFGEWLSKTVADYVRAKGGYVLDLQESKIILPG